MFGCYGSAAYPFWGLWWLIPLIGFIFCIGMCILFRRKMSGRCWCFPRGANFGDIEAIRKENRELREEIEKVKAKKQSGG